MEKDPPKAAAPRSKTSSRTARPSVAAPRSLARAVAREEVEHSTGEARVRQRKPPETRAQMLERLSNPLITLHEASVLLRVCTSTVRRLANQGELPHNRTDGGQRRFFLRDVMRVLQEREEREKQRSSTYRPLTRPPVSPSAPYASASRRSLPVEPPRARDPRARDPRARDPRELLAATHARAQAARLQAQASQAAAAQTAQKRQAVPLQSAQAPVGRTSGQEAPRPRSPLRLGVPRARSEEPRAQDEGASQRGDESGGEGKGGQGKGARAS